MTHGLVFSFIFFVFCWRTTSLFLKFIAIIRINSQEFPSILEKMLKGGIYKYYEKFLSKSLFIMCL